jgi:hypothetical protein
MPGKKEQEGEDRMIDQEQEEEGEEDLVPDDR